MGVPLGSRDVSGSGGTMRLAGRLGEGRIALLDDPQPLADAVRALEPMSMPPEPVLAAGPLVAAGQGPFLVPGTAVAWTYRPSLDVGCVLSDDARGLAVWIATGSARLARVSVAGRTARELPLEQRFATSWRMAEGRWRGPGIVRWAPTGRPWSVWWFYNERGEVDGLYVNLEMPHQRPRDGDARTHSGDLVLDLWIQRRDDGCHELWVKDEDEVEAAVAAGRSSAVQAVAVRSVGEWAARELFDPGVTFGPWDRFRPSAAQQRPLGLPDSPVISALKELTG